MCNWHVATHFGAKMRDMRRKDGAMGLRWGHACVAIVYSAVLLPEQVPGAS